MISKWFLGPAWPRPIPPDSSHFYWQFSAKSRSLCEVFAPWTLKPCPCWTTLKVRSTWSMVHWGSRNEGATLVFTTFWRTKKHLGEALHRHYFDYFCPICGQKTCSRFRFPFNLPFGSPLKFSLWNGWPQGPYARFENLAGLGPSIL